MNNVNKVSTVAEALSERAKIAVAGWSEATCKSGDIQIPKGLVESLTYHLLKGETHYPDRPGMSELREHVGRELRNYVDIPRDPDEVLITASEGEAIFVTMLGLDLVPGGQMLGEKGQHKELFDWMGIEVSQRIDTSVSVAYLELDGQRSGVEWFKNSNVDNKILTVGDNLYGENVEALGLPSDTIIVGSLSSLLGIHGFDLGFVSAEATLLKGVTAWKQASSICAPSPSQRAALWKLGEKP